VNEPSGQAFTLLRPNHIKIKWLNKKEAVSKVNESAFFILSFFGVFIHKMTV
jgi:hypothetical protein